MEISISGAVLSGLGSTFSISRRSSVGGGGMRFGQNSVIIAPKRKKSWVKTNHIRDSSFWCLDENKIASWTSKALLKLRPLAERFIRCKLGNDIKATFGFDRSCELGPLILYFGTSGPMQTGIQLTSTVAGACSGDGWLLRPARYSILCSARCLFPRSPSLLILTLGQRMTWTWTLTLQSTHGNLFGRRGRNKVGQIRCTYAEQLCKMAIKRLGYRPVLFHTWEALLAWISLKVRHCPTTLHKLTVQAVLYRLWRERNQHLHNGPSTPPQVCFKEIDRQIENAILARKHCRNFKHLMRIWLMHE
ncbi:hypothetical protein Bca101_009226 [Brassica carinata]